MNQQSNGVPDLWGFAYDNLDILEYEEYLKQQKTTLQKLALRKSVMDFYLLVSGYGQFTKTIHL